MKRLISIGLLLVAVAAGMQAQKTFYVAKDSVFIVNLLKHAPQDAGPLSFARQFLGRPYVAHTLELFDEERLIVNTRQLDCTTLVENVTALTLCARRGEASFESFVQTLRALRYRKGRQRGYASRLHYFSDWIADNTKMGYVNEVQRQQAPFTAVQTLGVSYMSQHPQAYKALRADTSLVKIIKAQEKALTGRRFRYIPKSRVKNTRALREVVHNGDIIAITCNKPGLDIAHLGFAVWRNDGLHLLNASSIHKKVVEEPMTLGQYLSKHPSFTGIRVVRVQH